MSTLDQNLLDLMNDTISWEAFQAQDGHGDPSYAAPVDLTCFIEERGYGGGMQAQRAPHRDTYDAFLDVWFDATDARVRTFDMRDRFTVTTQTDASKASQPERLLTFRGPDGSPLVTLVTL